MILFWCPFNLLLTCQIDTGAGLRDTLQPASSSETSYSHCLQKLETEQWGSLSYFYTLTKKRLISYDLKLSTVMGGIGKPLLHKWHDDDQQVIEGKLVLLDLIHPDIVDLNCWIFHADGYNVVVLWMKSKKCCCRWGWHECGHDLCKTRTAVSLTVLKANPMHQTDLMHGHMLNWHRLTSGWNGQ